MRKKNMYTPLVCKMKFNRLIDDGELENVKEEIHFYFFELKSCDIDYYDTIGRRGIHKHELFESPYVLFNIARKLWRNVAEVLYSDNFNPVLNDTHTYILDLLNFTRITFSKEHWANPDIRCSLSTFKKSIVHITELDQYSILKLITGANRITENPTSQYFHLYLDTLWLLLTLDELDVKFIITQLSYFSLKCYEKQKSDYITCKCLKSIWLRLQLFCENKGVDFWKEFNSALECYNEEFLINFIPFVACLHCYNSDGHFIGSNNVRVRANFEFLSTKWNLFIKTTNEDLLKHLKHIEGLLCDLWLESAKLDFLYSTWDYFYKKLEDIKLEFDFPALLERLKNNNVSDNSYLLFLRILLVQLKAHPGYWNKFRGRIYTRFSPAKFAKLNDMGVFNLMLLMIVLLEVSFSEITVKILEFLQAIPPDERNTMVVWKIYFILMEVNIRADRSIKTVADKLMPLATEVSLNRPQYYLLSLLPTHMDRFTSITRNFKLNQEVFFGVWIENYMKSCTHADLLNILNMLIIFVERVIETGVWHIYEKPLITHVLPSLKRIAVSSNIEMVGTLAGMISSSSPDLQQLAVLFSSENVPTNVIWAFFSQISKNTDLGAAYDVVILKSWFQCAIIGEANQDFTKFALSLDMVKCLNVSTSAKIEVFLEHLKEYTNRECLRACFEGLEKWLVKHLTDGKESNKINIIYFNMGMVFKFCGSLLYSKSHATCPLSKFIDLLLLPTEILRGIQPSSAVIKAMQEYWYIFVDAIFKMSTDDPYLDRVAKDIVVRYIPFFEENETSLIPISTDLQLMTFIITKMNIDFFLQGSTRSMHTYKVLLIVKGSLGEMLSTNYSRELVGLVLPAIYEVYMFKNLKIPVIDTIKVIMKSIPYVEKFFTGVFERSLRDLTKKHLPFNTSTYFQLVYVLAKVIPEEVKLVLGYIREEIVKVEAKRGQGFDNDLRSSYDKLIKILS